MKKYKYTENGELEVPETTYIRDIDNRVFEGIVIQSLAEINGIALIEGNFIDSIFGRTEQVKGIYANQENQSLNVRIEVNVAYGVSIPEKAEEIQSKVVADLVALTGLHVHQVHVVFKKLIAQKTDPKPSEKKSPPLLEEVKEYADAF